MIDGLGFAKRSIYLLQCAAQYDGSEAMSRWGGYMMIM